MLVFREGMFHVNLQGCFLCNFLTSRRSAFAEQTTPAVHLIYDEAASVTQIFFQVKPLRFEPREDVGPGVSGRGKSPTYFSNMGSIIKVHQPTCEIGKRDLWTFPV